MIKKLVKIGLFCGCLFNTGGMIVAITAPQYAMMQIESDLQNLLKKATTVGLSAAEKKVVDSNIATLSTHNPKKASDFKKKFASAGSKIFTVQKQIIPTTTLIEPKKTELAPTIPIALEAPIMPIALEKTPIISEEKKVEILIPEEKKQVETIVQKEEDIDLGQFHEQLDKLHQEILDIKLFKNVEEQFSKEHGFYFLLQKLETIWQTIESKRETSKTLQETLVMTALQNKKNDIIGSALRTIALFIGGSSNGEFWKIVQNFENHITSIQKATKEKRDNFLVDFYGTDEQDRTEEQKTRTAQLNKFYEFCDLIQKGGIQDILNNKEYLDFMKAEFNYLFINGNKYLLGKINVSEKSYTTSVASLVLAMTRYIIMDPEKTPKTIEKTEDKEDYVNYFNPLYQKFLNLVNILNPILDQDIVNAVTQDVENATDKTRVITFD